MKNLWKIALAALLAALLLAAGGAALAEDCAHEHIQYEWGDVQYHSTSRIYDESWAQYHSCSEYCTRYRVCQDCGTVLAEFTAVKEVFNEPHDFRDYWEYDEGPTYEPGDVNGHLVTGNVRHTVSCGCGYELVDERLENHTRVEAHVFNEYYSYSQNCLRCGFPCQHSWKNGKCQLCDKPCDHAERDANGNCAVCGLVGISAANFPDAALRAYLANGADRNGDGVLENSECISINVPSDATSIEGLELLSESIMQIYWYNAPVTELDLSILPNLEHFSVYNSKKLTRLDLSGCTSLKHFEVDGCTALTALDVTHCPLLKYAYFRDAPISRLDFSKNPELKSVYGSRSGLTELDLSHNPKLVWVDLGQSASLVALDVSACPELENLYCGDTAVRMLDVSHNLKLQQLSLSNVPVGALDLSRHTALTSLRATNCGLKSLRLCQTAPLENLTLDDNPLDTLDLRGMTQLKMLYFQGNRLSTLTLGEHPNLTQVFLTSNDSAITELDVTGCPALEKLNVECSRLRGIDLSHNPKLRELTLDGTFSEVDLSHNPELRELSVQYMHNLRWLDVSHNSRLQKLYCEYTQVENLDLSNNPALTYVTVRGSPFSHLDVSACPDLGRCRLFGNTRSVPVTGNTFDLSALEGFDVSRASNWQGGKVKGNTLTFTAAEVSYTYDCGMGYSGTFKLAKGGEDQGFKYKLLADGTASITWCGLTGDVVIPGKLDGHVVTHLEQYLFNGAAEVDTVTIPASVTQMGDQSNSQLAYEFPFSSVKAIYVDAASKTFKSVDGVLFNKSGDMLYAYPPMREGEEYHLPAECDFLDCQAFSGTKNLHRVYLTNPETSWSMYAFADVSRMTVYYRKGGRTEVKVRDAVGEGLTTNDGMYYPFFLPYGNDESSLAGYDARIQAVIDEAVAPGMTQREKAAALHDWITRNAHYSLLYDDAYGLLVHGMGHCQAYARTYKLLLEKVGIECRLLEGVASTTGLAHMWNAVKLDNVWYEVDCTWDDPTYLPTEQYDDQEALSGYEMRDYCLISHQRMGQDHSQPADAETPWSGPVGWQPESDRMAFLDADGNRLTGWLEIDGGKFFFGADGYNVTGTGFADRMLCTFEPMQIYRDGAGDHYAGNFVSGVELDYDLALPMAMKEVRSQAFAGVKDVTIFVPAGVTYIAEDAFDPSVTILCYEDSYARTRCEALGLSVIPL